MKNNKVLIFGLCGESVFMRCDHFHTDGETIVIDELYKEPGGKGYNQAVTVKKQEVDTCFVTMVGNDEFGLFSKAYLDKVGVCTKFFINNDISSAYATILRDKFGNNQVSVYPGASHKMSVSDIISCEYLFDEYKYVLLTLELCEDVTKKIVELANIHNCKIILNPAPYKPYVHDLVDQVWIMIPNFSEAKSLFDLDNNTSYSNLANEIIKRNYKHMIVTLGKDGVLLVNGSLYEIIPSKLFDQSKVVDTTGAGDIFCGAFTSMIVKGYSLIESVKYAISASSHSVMYPYVMPSIPSVCDVIDEPLYQVDNYFPKKEITNTRNTVRVFAQNEDGKFGMLRIIGTDEFGDRNHLESSGGGIEKGECKLDAVKREVKEELGYECRIISKFCTIKHEFNLISRLTIANYYYVLVDTTNCVTHYTDSEKLLFKGVEWYTLDELEIELKKPNNKVGSIVHERELMALYKLKEYFKRVNGDKNE